MNNRVESVVYPWVTRMHEACVLCLSLLFGCVLVAGPMVTETYYFIAPVVLTSDGNKLNKDIYTLAKVVLNRFGMVEVGGCGFIKCIRFEKGGASLELYQQSGNSFPIVIHVYEKTLGKPFSVGAITKDLIAEIQNEGLTVTKLR